MSSSFGSRVTPAANDPKPLGRLPFVGREAELRRLRQVATRARTGTGAVVLVAGESGVGKTRLVETLVNETRAQGWAHAAGQAYAVERGCPYAVIAEALSSIVRRLDASAISVAARGTESELARILPSLGTARRAGEDQGDPDLKARLHWHFAQFLRRLATKTPLLVELDNLQWCDDSSLELLHFVGRQLEGSSLLIVCTYHPGESDLLSAPGRVIHSLTQQGLAHLLELAPLPESDIVELVKRAFGASGRLVEDFARRLHAQTRGHPFFTEEVLKALVERGAIRNVDGSWTGWQADVAHLPTSVRAAVQVRLGHLPESARSVAAVLAVVGTPATLPLIKRLSGHSVRELADIMDQLTGRGILVELRERDEVAYDFAHPMVRSVLYEGLGSARAKSHHVDVAAGLESLYGDRALGHAAELAPHLEQGADLVENDRAVEYFMAGRDALDRHADRESERFLSLALDIVDRSASNRFEAALPGLLATLARARQRIGALASAVLLLERARALARSSGDVAAQAGLERRLGLASLVSGGTTNAVEHFREAERLAMDAGLADLAVRSRIAHATALQSVGRLADAEQLLLEVLPLAQRIGNQGLLARVHRAMVLLYVWAGPAEEAHNHGAEALRYAEASGDSGTTWSVHWSLALLASFTGDSAGVLRHQRVAERLARDINSPFLLASAAEIGIEYASAAAMDRWAGAGGASHPDRSRHRTADAVASPARVGWHHAARARSARSRKGPHG